MANLTATTITGNLDVTGGGVITGNGSGLSGVDPFASGTKMVFYQASAPTGWTQDTAAALSNTVMSVVTGTGGGTGGSTSYFSSFLATTNKSAPAQPVSGSLSGTVGGHTLSTPEIATHLHIRQGVSSSPSFPSPTALPNGVTTASNSGFRNQNFQIDNPTNVFQAPTENTGGGGSHSHPFSGSLSSATADVTIPAANVKYANVIVAAKD